MFSFFKEPVGSVGPRINLVDKLGFAVNEEHTSLALFCPAQSFPVPAFRYYFRYDLLIEC